MAYDATITSCRRFIQSYKYRYAFPVTVSMTTDYIIKSTTLYDNKMNFIDPHS